MLHSLLTSLLRSVQCSITEAHLTVGIVRPPKLWIRLARLIDQEFKVRLVIAVILCYSE